MEPHSKTLLAVERGGTLIFDGSAHIGKGSKIYVAKNANLKLGDNFAISASTQISCHKSIQFGKNNSIQLGLFGNGFRFASHIR